MKHFILLVLATACLAQAQEFTRGGGIYPGDPREYAGPTLTADTGTYRNLALRRPAFQSSAYDYNLTAQLITDSIKDQEPPAWISTYTSDAGILDKSERELFLDGDVVSSIKVDGEKTWVEFDIEGGTPPELDRVDLYLRKFDVPHSGAWTYTVLGLDDRTSWKELGRATGMNWPDASAPGPSFKQSIPFAAPARSRYYSVELSAADVHTWLVAETVLFDRDREVRIAGPSHFTSAWMSASGGQEWVYVDLGASCTFDRVTLSWIRRAAEGSIQVSNDATEWTTIHSLTSAATLTDDIHLEAPVRGRYVRVLMTRPREAGNYVLSELEVFGRGGLVPKAKSAAPARADGKLELTGGAWRLQRDSLVNRSGEDISRAEFPDKNWLVATVPGTVLTSYLNAGAVPDPDFGDNQYTISDSFFYSDFWYRDEFIGPAIKQPHQHFWLNFDGVNWKAEIFLNGTRVGRIDGAFMRGRFDVTSLVHAGARNALAVRILKNANPGSVKDKAGVTLNGGALGRDNPTYHATVGWDWISTIRGRDTGIWSNVSLTSSGPVTIGSPEVTTTLPLPDTTHADVAIEATLRNLEGRPVKGTLRARFGEITVEEPITLGASETRTIRLDPATDPALRLVNPKLWWPAGYGDPNLYTVQLSFVAGKRVSDATTFQSGVRQFTYSEDDGTLKIWINGRRLIARGGNWGFSESMLRYRSREYETAMRYHRDQHFNMIRDWVGQIGDEALYDAADRNGIVIWQDFWLANPWDGPDPDDNELFLMNARDYVLRIRNHASVGLYCGRNEGFPPQLIDDGLRNLVSTLAPGTHYISSSADGPVSGHGPYQVEPLKFYFANAPTKFHSEMGAPNVVEMESLRRTMPESAMWPQSSQWPLHDYYADNPFTEAIEQQYGGATSLSNWMSFAQFVDYDAYRGMFEGQSKKRLGLLIWMSHPAWPSLLWQTYDYFYETDAGYFGAKKGSEPLHVQWNAATDAVEVVNYSAGNQTGLTAHAELLNLDGSVKWEKTAVFDSQEDSTMTPLQMTYPAGLTRTHFIRLTLTRAGAVISSNFYLHGLIEGDYQGIRDLPKAAVDASTQVERRGTVWQLTTELRNTSTTPALMVRVKAVREKTGDHILPAIYDDNYVALMPGERRTIRTELENADTRDERPRIVVEGYNIRSSGDTH